MTKNYIIKIKKAEYSNWEDTSFGKLTFETACALVDKLSNIGCFYSVAKFITE